MDLLKMTILEILVIPRVFKSESGEFLTQGFSVQKSIKICSIMEIPWNGEAEVHSHGLRRVTE